MKIQKITKTIFTLVAIFLATECMAQQPWKIYLQNKELNLRLNINLYEETIIVPNMEMFGPMNGYLGGTLSNIWTITSFKIENDEKATLRLSNDLGSETQECVLFHENDSTYRFEVKGSQNIRKVVNRKYQKLPTTIYFEPRR